MTLAAAFSQIAVAFSDAMGGPFHRARVIDQVDAVYDDGGSIIGPGTPRYRECRAQVDGVTLRMREASGYVAQDVAIIVLADTLAGSLSTEAKVELLEGPHAGKWSVELIEYDTAALGWSGRGRRA
jgi:hypothetical protein